MADPITPTPEQLKEVTELTKQYNDSQMDTNRLMNESVGILDRFKNVLSSSEASLQGLGKAASDSTGVFVALGSAVIKARGAFDGISNVDSKSVTTFTSHFKDLREVLLSSGTAGKEFRDKLDVMRNQFSKMGDGALKQFEEAAKKGAGAVLTLMENMAAHADRGIAFEASMMKAAGATGEFGTLMDKAGPHMEKLNILMDEQTYQMNLASKATNSTQEQIDSYYNSLRQVPGALYQIVNANENATEKMSLLTATIKLAHGTGRDYNEVVKDLHKSFSDYGVSGENALKFTSRFSEIANKYGLELEDVRSGLMAAADAFKNITNAGEAASNMQENLSKLTNDYVQRLKDTGMTGRHALETVQSMTGAMSHLNIAQKAFLSAQTGGPGGIMGGLQIEKMLREGKIEEVQEKMMKVFQKQFGKVVTLDEGTQSQAAAAQLIKQRAMLQQGPLGSIIKSDDDANRFLEAMKAKSEGRAYTSGKVLGEAPTDLAKGSLGLQEAISKGSIWEEKTHTVVSDISNDLRSIRDRVSTQTLGTVQRAVTGAALPQTGPRTEAQERMQRQLHSSMTTAAVTSGKRTEQLANEMQNKGTTKMDRSKTNIADSVNSMVGEGKLAVDTFRSGFHNMGESAKQLFNKSISSETTPNIEAETNARRDAQEKAGTAPTAKPAPPGQQLGTATRRVVRENFSSLDPKHFGEAPRAGAVVGAAPRGTPAAPKGATGAGEVPAPPTVTVDQPSSSGRFKVHVTVTEDKSDNSKAITPAGM